jgi:hypothetical protein
MRAIPESLAAIKKNPAISVVRTEWSDVPSLFEGGTPAYASLGRSGECTRFVLTDVQLAARALQSLKIPSS